MNLLAPMTPRTPTSAPGAEDLVGLHPHKAAVLASELRRMAQRFLDHGTTTFDALVQGLEDPGLAVALCDATEWFGDQARTLQRTIDDVVRAFADGPIDRWAGMEVWRQPYALAFDDPVGATTAATEAAGLLPALVDPRTGEPGDPDGDGGRSSRLRTLLAQWMGNEVFAVELARRLVHTEGLGVGALGQLVRLDAEWRRHGRPEPGEGGADTRRLVFATLATASRAGWLGFRFDDLRRDVQGGDGEITDRDARTLMALGVLFGPGIRWDAGFLLDAVDTFVRPVNRAFPQGEIVFQDNGYDPRVPVLAAIADNPDAATALLARPDAFRDLFAARFGYDDGGRALSEVLRVGTAPGTASPAPGGDDLDPRAANMQRFVWWVLAHPDLPPVTRAQLGVITAPWIASFRKPGYDDDPTIGNPLRALTDDSRTRFLDYVADDLHALMDLRVAELLWAQQAFRRIAGGAFDGRGIALVANVDRRTSRSARNGLLRNLKREDDQINFDKEVWEAVVSVVTFPMRDYVDFAVDTGIHLVGDVARPPSTMALDYATAFPALEVSDDRKLQWALIAALWDARAQNHVFDGVPDPPPNIVFGEPPQLLPISDMTAADFEAWITWIDDGGLRRRAHWEELTVDAEG